MSQNQDFSQEGYPTIPPEGYPEGCPTVPVEGYQAAPQEAYGAFPQEAPSVDPQFYQASSAQQAAYEAVASQAAYQAPEQAAYQASEQVVYQSPEQVVYQAPAQAVYQTPEQAAAYQVPAQPMYQAPAQPEAAPMPPLAPQAPLPPDDQGKKKKKKKGGCFWRLIFWLALIVFIVSVGILGYLLYTYWSSQHEYDEIATQAVSIPTENEMAPNLADLVVDWDALRAINPDVVAWVYVPGTVINYPVAHKEGDSEYYLHHNFSLGEGSFGAEFGSIMLSGDNAADFSDEVNILYGHHMRNGSMFALLAEFRESEAFNEHRTFYLLTPEGNYRLNTFAVEHVPMTHASIATPNYATDEEFMQFKQWLVDEDIITPDPNIDAEALDATKLFGFCTCDGADNTWRYITFAIPVEFVPIQYVGTGEYHGTATVEGDAAGEIAGAEQERVEG